ncbi:MAG: ATP-binding cassette domain-containing protein [Ignavibacteria bacterium]|nr:ATP-binding cassette domain-containing protein [Ignavibacteria bacterium]
MISLENISVNFGTRYLFDGVNFMIGAKDRIGLVGVNGSGKTTLMKIICRMFTPDSGNIIYSRHTTAGYLPQEGIEYSGRTLYEEVYSSAGNIIEIQKEIEEIEKEIQSYSDKESEEYLDQLQNLSELQERFSLLDGYKLTGKIEKILYGLGFKENDMQRDTNEFSGGWQMRIALAKLLLNNPSVLLLDEPTNHLDFDSLIWLEDYLKSYNGSYLIISHDKDFLNNLTEKIIEISLGNVNIYSGNYDKYYEEKTLRKQQTENQYRNQQKYLKQQERFIERFRYKATKASAVQSRIKQLEKIERIEIEDEESFVNFRFPPAIHSGRVVVDINNLTKSYDGKNNVLENVNLSVSRGEKIALVGVNGTGKSTLARIIADKEPYNRGEIIYGHQVVTRYFAQNQAEELNENRTVLETLEEVASGQTQNELRSILGGFLFSGEDVFKKVGVLSGGEKSRLALAKMLLQSSNFLILDEPTNHLDMRSKEVLKKALREYKGAVLIVSHDREFLDGVIDKILEIKSKNFRTFRGTIFEYAKIKQNEILKSETEEVNIVKEENTEKKSPYLKGLEIKNRKKEINKKITPVRRKISVIEQELNELEARKKELENIMSGKNFYKDVECAKKISGEYDHIGKRAKELNKQWDTETDMLNNLLNELSLID